MDNILETVILSLDELLKSVIQTIPAFLTAIIIIFLTRYFSGFVQKVAKRVGERALKSSSLKILLNKACLVGTWVFGILFACVVAFPGFDLGDIISTLGLGSVAIGFAFQDIFKNFLAGILLLLEEPFRIGDEVIIDEYQGIVEHIDIRTTQIRTYEGEKVLLPNSSVFTNAVKVRTAYAARRSDLAVGVDYDTDLSQAEAILIRTIKKVEGVLSNPAPNIDLVNFGDSSIDFVVRYWTLPPQKEVRKVQTSAIKAIKKMFDRENIVIPYPIRTLYSGDKEGMEHLN